MIRPILFAVALALSAPAFAQAAPDPKALAAARELMAATDIKGQMRAVGPRLAEAMGAQARGMFADSRMPEGLQTQCTAAVQAYVASMDSVFTPALIDQFATTYARHFSVAELQRLTAIMHDPAMVRFRTQTPAIMSELMPTLFAAMKPQQQRFQAKLRQIITDWIAKHPEDKAKLRSPVSS